MESRLQEKIALKIKEIDAIANSIPGPIIIHNVQKEFAVEYMSPIGLEGLGKTLDEIKGLTNAEYHKHFFKEDYTQDHVPKIIDLLKRNTDESVSFFQQVRSVKTNDWDWYMTSIKVLLRDDSNKPVLTISLALKVDPQNYFTAKATRLLEDNIFLKNHYDKFAELTVREKEILKLLVVGKSAGEIANDLHISALTAETHRKNIKNKLNIRNSYELSQYARAFDLI